MTWSRLAKYPNRFREFVAHSGENARRFWSQVDIQMTYRVTTHSEPTLGPRLTNPENLLVKDDDADMTPYQQLLDMEREQEEAMLLENQAHEADQLQIAKECRVELVSDDE